MLFDNIFVIIFLPILDRLIYPFLDRKGIHLSLLARMAIGMALAAVSMIAAGLLETYRLGLLHHRFVLITSFQSFILNKLRQFT